MKLIDLLNVCMEYQTVLLYNEDSDPIGEYNGRDSISPEYNDRTVESVETGMFGELLVTIK